MMGKDSLFHSRYRPAWAALCSCLAVCVILYVGIWQWWSRTNPNPCQTWTSNRTGTVVARGHTFTCWHGEIAGIK